MRALLLVDIQNDFLPGGPLGVPQGDEVVPVANQLLERFDLAVATQDWHPPDHISFISQHPGHQVGDVIEVDGLEQIIWPDHCVQGTPGAELVPGLNRDAVAKVLRKGTDRRIDSYSGFYDNGHRKATGLGDFLKEQGVESVYVVGLATDVCVKYTALDARRLGFSTYVVRDGCRGVNQQPGDVDQALAEMQSAGAVLIDTNNIS